ncbi:SEC-C metal-binding domain-containing protein, partial [Alistipes indistinctus]
RHALYGERIEVDLNNIMMDYAQSFVDTYSEDDFEDFKFNMIRQVAVQPSFDEATYKSASKEMLTGMVVKDFQDAYMRRIGSVAATAYPVIKRVYEEQGDKYENIYIPVSDGFRGYNVPVNLKKAYDSQCKEVFKSFSTIVVLTTIDENWKEHLREMDELRQSVQNATYEQKDPLLIYKFESFNLFSKMLEKVNREILSTLFKAFIPVRENPEAAAPQQPVAPPKTDMSRMQTSRMEAAAAAGQGDKSKPAPIHVEKKVGRNDPCPCGSGKKYKHCHGQNE